MASLAGGIHSGRVLIALGAVGPQADSDKAAFEAEVVGVALTALDAPLRGTGVPCLGKGHDVVDVELAGIGDGLVVVVGAPAAT